MVSRSRLGCFVWKRNTSTMGTYIKESRRFIVVWKVPRFKRTGENLTAWLSKPISWFLILN